jgi:hypothetical protein
MKIKCNLLNTVKIVLKKQFSKCLPEEGSRFFSTPRVNTILEPSQCKKHQLSASLCAVCEMPKTKVALASRFHCVCGRVFWSLIKSCLSAVFIYPLRQHSSRARRRLRYQGTCIFPFISSARICMEKIPPLSRVPSSRRCCTFIR